jgi:hypothetical protein
VTDLCYVLSSNKQAIPSLKYSLFYEKCEGQLEHNTNMSKNCLQGVDWFQEVACFL